MILLSEHADAMTLLHPDYPTGVPGLDRLYEDHLERVVTHFEVRITPENRATLAKALRTAADRLDEAGRIDRTVGHYHPAARERDQKIGVFIDDALAQARSDASS